MNFIRQTQSIVKHVTRYSKIQSQINKVSTKSDSVKG